MNFDLLFYNGTETLHKYLDINQKVNLRGLYEISPLYAVCRRGCDVIASILHNSGAEIDLYYIWLYIFSAFGGHIPPPY